MSAWLYFDAEEVISASRAVLMTLFITARPSSRALVAGTETRSHGCSVTGAAPRRKTAEARSVGRQTGAHVVPKREMSAVERPVDAVQMRGSLLLMGNLAQR